MKTKLSKLFIVVILTGFSFALSAQNNTEVRQKIEEYNKDMAEAMIEGDNEKLLILYDEDAISLPNNDKMIRGKEAIRKANEELDKQGWKVVSYEPEIVSVEVFGDVVHEIGTYKMKAEKANTGDSRSIEGKYVAIWEMQDDGSMKIKTEIWNHDSNYSMPSLSESRDNSGRIFDSIDNMDDDMNRNEMKKDIDARNPEGHNMTDDKK